ncbi:MAG: hypothetical protein WCK17_03540 [Verrucomicrobiota bacterium]
MAIGIRWGEGGGGQTTQETGEEKPAAQSIVGGLGVKHCNSQGGSHGKMGGSARQREALRHAEEVLEGSECRASGEANADTRPHASLDYQTPAEHASRATKRSAQSSQPPKPRAPRIDRRSGNKVANATTTVGITNNQLNQNHEKLS